MPNIFPEGIYNQTPVRDVINAFTPDHRDAIAIAEDALTESYNADNSGLDDMSEDILDQTEASSEAALDLLKSGYEDTRAKLVKVQDTLDGIDDWIAGDLEDMPPPPPPPTPPEDTGDEEGDEGEEEDKDFPGFPKDKG